MSVQHNVLVVKFRTILCPVDFSAPSRTALRFALATTRRFRARLTVMFVNDPLLLAAANAAYKGRRRFVDRTNTELARFVKRATGRDHESNEDVALIVGVGNPADEIL